MSAFATALLQAAMSLLLLVQGNPSIDQATRDNAIKVANQAVQVATSELAERNNVSPVSGPKIKSVNNDNQVVSGQPATIRGLNLSVKGGLTSVYFDGKKIEILRSQESGGEFFVEVSIPNNIMGKYQLYVISDKQKSNIVSIEVTGPDPALKQNLLNIRSQAEIYYVTNNYSYSGLCSDTNIRHFLDIVTSNSPGTPDCKVSTSGQFYAVESQINLRPSGAPSFFCADSSGYQNTRSFSKGKSSSSCVQE